jgi:hypothetical protein
MGLLKILMSLHTWLSGETCPEDGQFVEVAVNREELSNYEEEFEYQ